VWTLRDRSQLEQLLLRGARYAVECGHGG
jgi:hypothetical protein